MTILLLGHNGLFGQHFTKKYPDIFALGSKNVTLPMVQKFSMSLKSMHQQLLLMPQE